MKSFKYRLYPTKKQVDTLQWMLDRCRELYNAALQERREAWKMCHISINFAGQAAQMPEIKKIREEYQDVYAQVLIDVLHRVDKACKLFFGRIKKGEKAGYPRFQGRDRYDSFTYPQVGKIQGHQRGPIIETNGLKLPRVGRVKTKFHQTMPSNVRTCTIKREGQYWYACFVCEIEAKDFNKSPYTDNPVGIDLGLHHFAALSTGDIIENPRHYHKSEQKIIKAEQALSRKKKGSKRRKKAVQRLNKHHRKVRNQRQDFLHQWSRRLVNTYETIVFEDLPLSQMCKRPKPKQDKETGNTYPMGQAKRQDSIKIYVMPDGDISLPCVSSRQNGPELSR